MSNTPVVIQVDKLTKYYGKSIGVKDASFEVRRGEIFGFLGPNGSGKTTTIRLMLDLLRPDSGQVIIFGKEVRKHSVEIRRRCGYLPGEFSAYGHLHAGEFLKLLAGIRGKTVPWDSGLFDLFDLRNTDLSKKIKALSHGNLQKTGIIQAFMHQPELLILDEPTTALDPLMKEVFYELVFDARQNGATVFLSSHNLTEVEKLCTRVAIVRRGRIVEVDSLESMRSRAGQLMELEIDKTWLIKNQIPGLPGAKYLRSEGNRLVYRIGSDVDAIIKKLAEIPVRQISISRQELENLFMDYYKDQNSNGNVVR